MTSPPSLRPLTFNGVSPGCLLRDGNRRDCRVALLLAVTVWGVLFVVPLVVSGSRWSGRNGCLRRGGALSPPVAVMARRWW